MALQQLDRMFQMVSVQDHVVSLMRAVAVISGELAIHAKDELLELFDYR